MFAQKKYLSSIMINLLMRPYSFAYFSETTPSIEISNYQAELAYIINSGPEVVVGKDYKNACLHLALFGYEWKVIPTTDVNPACYSPTDRKIMGADTWFCADGSVAYYNIPWWSCNAFRVCPNATWTLAADGLNCTRPTTTCTDKPTEVSEIKLIAAIVYGEASPNSPYEERAAIANALVRKSKSYKYTSVNEFVAKRGTQLSSLHPINVRVREVLCSDLENDFHELYQIALNALDENGVDYANGGCFWDGIDLLTKGENHLHFKWGYKFTNPEHDVFNAGDTPPINEKHPDYDFALESTAGYGHTVFWKYTQEFMAATGTEQCH